ncbi:phosphatase PAP2 family protein [Fulvivirga sp. RKSG066]|uniref:phosphatase PAP2 family protein n=1 Tax=Fulvivirga aurantia TaxID=2529383 RepID=UPI0012BC9C92|nr:phosphatase PAP2 family protein [Fulvivirga aurantia]MTI23214.1 phosphatase PAP2 family protein [Fulvivirga aurantia]
MFETILEWDRELFLFLNSLHNPTLDTIMYWYTQKYVWFPVYAVLIFFIFKEYKWKGVVMVLAAAAAVGLADFIISGVMKPYFERWRPSRDPSLEGMVHLVNEYTGGKFGFASAHAGTAFSLATYTFLIFRHKYKWVGLVFIWSFIMAYTRIYLGVHYPGDIIVGTLIGVLLGFLFYKLAQWICQKYWSH